MKNGTGRKVMAWLPLAGALAGLLSLCAGCATPAQTAGAIAGGFAGTMVVGGYSPAQEIEQVYYLGAFDPQEQVPPAVYRITVHGQASAISGMKFGSGWVPAQLIDSLNSHIGMDVNAKGYGLSITKGEDHLAELKTGRRLVEFGPEGFREVPTGQRLVIVMGASPKAFFEAIDQALGDLSGARAERSNSALRQRLFEALVRVQSEREGLADVEADAKQEFAK